MNSPDTASRLNNALSGRYAIERELGEGGMVIVGSILLAFGIDAWWEPAPCESG